MGDMISSGKLTDSGNGDSRRGGVGTRSGDGETGDPDLRGLRRIKRSGDLVEALLWLRLAEFLGGVS